MPTTKKPPLPVGAPVAINIAEGMSVAQGVIAAAEYDDGWFYRIAVTGGDDCRLHRNRDGELWVCDFEVSPTGSAPSTETPHATVYSAIIREIATKGKDSRFKKAGRGKFTVNR